MAPKTARQLGILAVLLVVLAVVLTWNRDPVSSSQPQRPQARRGAGASGAGPGDDVGVVNMPALAMARPEPETGARNPFRFRPVAPPPPPPEAAMQRPPGPGEMAGSQVPAGPPPPPPITLKFIGLVEQNTKLKLAVLSDGRNVFYGKEGDTIEGRYRIERIGPESIDMAYLDGRGRQTLRLSGS